MTRSWRAWLRCCTRGVVAPLLVSLLLPHPLAGQVGSPTEYEIKAAFLFNFAKFVEWPAQTFPKADSPIIIGVLGADPFGRDLNSVIDGKSVNGREIIIRRFPNPEDVTACHILFVSAQLRNDLPRTPHILRRAGVLTVSDMDRFTSLGGIIQLWLDRGKVRFEINVEAAERDGLKVSSKLIRLAKPAVESTGQP